MDSTGEPIDVGDRVKFRGHCYTIKAIKPGDAPRSIEFVEPCHTDEVPTEFSVDAWERAHAT